MARHKVRTSARAAQAPASDECVGHNEAWMRQRGLGTAAVTKCRSFSSRWHAARQLRFPRLSAAVAGVTFRKEVPWPWPRSRVPEKLYHAGLELKGAQGTPHHSISPTFVVPCRLLRPSPWSPPGRCACLPSCCCLLARTPSSALVSSKTVSSRCLRIFFAEGVVFGSHCANPE